MAVDPSMRDIKFPPRFLPYLEKHRVYELFFELGNELAMTKPSDHLNFLRESLVCLQKVRHRALVILMCPPYLDRVKLAHQLSASTGYSLISRYLTCSKPRAQDFYDPETLARNTADLIKGTRDEGCILVDFPDTAAEAKRLIQLGVLPTHSLLLLDDEMKGGEEEISENEEIKTVDTTPSLLLEFNNEIHKLKELYKSSLKVINMKGKTLEEIVTIISQLVIKTPFRPAPKLFRVVLIGPRGSRRKTIAKILKERFKLVHVDMLQLISAAQFREDRLGDKIRYLDSNGYPLSMKIVMELLRSRLYQQDCLGRGYVLTNFPCSQADFVLLDSLEIPPNKVIFFDMKSYDCQARLEDRVVDMNTGRLYSKLAVADDKKLKTATFTHPDDEPCKVAEELKFYEKRVQAMMDYCGDSCSVVDANCPVPALLEKVEAVLMGPSRASIPRPGKMTAGSTGSGGKPILRKDESKQRLPYPISQTVVAPFVDSEDLLRRFNDLKGGIGETKSVTFMPGT